MLESRSSYGWYGEFGGMTGENEPNVRKSGWHFHNFHFEISSFKYKGFSTYVEIRACDYAHAMKQLKAWAKRDGFIIVGDRPGWENQRNL